MRPKYLHINVEGHHPGVPDLIWDDRGGTITKYLIVLNCMDPASSLGRSTGNVFPDLAPLVSLTATGSLELEEGLNRERLCEHAQPSDLSRLQYLLGSLHYLV